MFPGVVWLDVYHCLVHDLDIGGALCGALDVEGRPPAVTAALETLGVLLQGVGGVWRDDAGEIAVQGGLLLVLIGFYFACKGL